MNKIFNKITIAFSYYKLLINLISLNKNLRSSHIIFFFSILVCSAFFELTLLGFLFVLIKAFMDPTYYQGHFFFRFILDIFNINSNSGLIFYLSSFFVTIAILAGSIRLIFLKLVAAYVYHFGKDVTEMCYQRIIYQDYKNLLNHNINESLSILQKMYIVVSSFYGTLIMIYSLITFIFIFGILSYINFKITIIASLFFTLLYLIIILIFKKRIFNNATVILNEQSTNIKIVRETFNGFRDILINNYQNFYNNIFSKSYSKIIFNSEDNRFFYSAPKPIIESFLLASIGLIIGFNADSYNLLENLIPNIAVLAIASQKILPILNQLYSGHMSNQDALPHLSFIKNYLNKTIVQPNRKKIKPLKFKNKISIKDVSFSYSLNNQPTVLKNINLDIFVGQRIGIIGKSGCGKSTFADLILGLIDPTHGNIYVDGNKISDQRQNWFVNVASVPQNIFITEQSIAENIAFGETKKQIKLNSVKQAAKKAQIADFIEQRKGKYKNTIGEKGIKISTGQRQRIAIARALYKKSKLIIFDEATSSVDEESEKNILNIIFSLSRKNHTSILISHKLSNLKRCDHIYKIKDSKLIKVK